MSRAYAGNDIHDTAERGLYFRQTSGKAFTNAPGSMEPLMDTVMSLQAGLLEASGFAHPAYSHIQDTSAANISAARCR